MNAFSTSLPGRSWAARIAGTGLVAAALLLSGGCGGSGSSSGPPPSSGQYRVIGLGVLPNGTNSAAKALNSKGEVVGDSLVSGSLHATLYSGTTLTDLGTLPGGSSGEARDINTSGQVVGASEDGSRNSFAFLYSGGVMQSLGALPGDTTSTATGINTSGQVVGYSQDFSILVPPNDPTPSPTHAFAYNAGTLTPLGALPGDDYSIASAINDGGQIVGDSFTPRGPHHAFLLTSGTLKDIGTPEGMSSSAMDINARGQIVGSFGVFKPPQIPLGGDRNMAHAFLYAGSGLTDLGVLPGDESSEATAINDSGVVVGTSSGISTKQYVVRPFVYRNGRMIDLNTLIPAGSGWVLIQATDINNAGQICGTGEYQGKGQAFLLTPQ